MPPPRSTACASSPTLSQHRAYKAGTHGLLAQNRAPRDSKSGKGSEVTDTVVLRRFPPWRKSPALRKNDLYRLQLQSTDPTSLSRTLPGPFHVVPYSRLKWCHILDIWNGAGTDPIYTVLTPCSQKGRRTTRQQMDLLAYIVSRIQEPTKSRTIASTSSLAPGVLGQSSPNSLSRLGSQRNFPLISGAPKQKTSL